MASSRRRLRIAAVSTGLFVVFLLTMGSAAAATQGRSTAAAAVTSGSWAAAPAATASTPTPGSGYVISWTSIAVTSQYFKVVNLGTLPLTSQTYTATNAKPANGNVLPVIALDACVSGVWNPTTGACAGTVVRLTTTSQAATSATISLPTGSTLSVRASAITLPANLQPFTTTVSVSVTNAQARPAATTTS